MSKTRASLFVLLLVVLLRHAFCEGTRRDSTIGRPYIGTVLDLPVSRVVKIGARAESERSQSACNVSYLRSLGSHKKRGSKFFGADMLFHSHFYRNP